MATATVQEEVDSRQLASGAVALLDDRGRVVRILTDPQDIADWEQYGGPEQIGCECEIDWRCPLHAGQPTWLETRYADVEDRF